MPDNLYALPATTDHEVFGDLLKRPGLRIERIVSTGQCQPAGFLVRPGRRRMGGGCCRARRSCAFADEGGSPPPAQAGDFVDIAAQRRHRVDWTPADQTTIWLAVFYSA
jgi:cupin 2 domain-containing protein